MLISFSPSLSLSPSLVGRTEGRTDLRGGKWKQRPSAAMGMHGCGTIMKGARSPAWSSVDVMLSEFLFLHHSTSEICILLHMLTTQCGGYNSDGRLALKAAFLPPSLPLPAPAGRMRPPTRTLLHSTLGRSHAQWAGWMDGGAGGGLIAEGLSPIWAGLDRWRKEEKWKKRRGGGFS